MSKRAKLLSLTVGMMLMAASQSAWPDCPQVTVTAFYYSDANYTSLVGAIIPHCHPDSCDVTYTMWGDFGGYGFSYTSMCYGAGRDFYTLPPCRLVDTRQPADAPALVSSGPRQFVLTGKCGVPPDAKALALNVTAVGASAQGYVTFTPGGQSFPMTSTVNFNGGDVRATNTILRLATDGSGHLGARAFVTDGGAVHVVLDVTGYFK